MRLRNDSCFSRETLSPTFRGVTALEPTAVPVSLAPLSPAAARERILRVLGSAPRPLKWVELQNSLGLLTNDARSASEWLMDQGYIAPTQLDRGAARSAEAFWTLGDKGRAWARRNGVVPTLLRP